MSVNIHYYYYYYYLTSVSKLRTYIRVCGLVIIKFFSHGGHYPSLYPSLQKVALSLACRLTGADAGFCGLLCGPATGCTILTDLLLEPESTTEQANLYKRRSVA